MRALQILIDGFAIGALYGLGAVGFTLTVRRLRRAQSVAWWRSWSWRP